jgi:hypothetical protein
MLLTSGKTGFDVSWLNNYANWLNFSKWWFKFLQQPLFVEFWSGALMLNTKEFSESEFVLVETKYKGAGNSDHIKFFCFSKMSKCSIRTKWKWW